MKITITPETDAERAKTRTVSVVGLRSVAVIGVVYDGDVIRQPYSTSYGDVEDLLRELSVVRFRLEQALVKAEDDNAGR